MNFVSGSLAIALSALLIASPVSARPFAADAPVSADSIQLQLVSKADSSFRINSLCTTGLQVEVIDAAGMPVSDAAVAFRLPDDGASGTFPDGSRSMVRYTDRSGKAQSAAIRWNSTPGPVSIRITAAKGGGHAGLLLDEMLTQGALPATAALHVNRPQIEARAIETRAAVNAPPSTDARDSDSDDEQDVARSGAASADEPLPDPEPSVSITSASPAGGPHISKKWIILAAVAAAAGVGAMMALRATGGSSSGGASSGVSIGSPTISIGHP